MYFSLVISLIIFLLIAVKQWLPKKIKIWNIMALGAAINLITGQLSISEALHYIDWNIIFYLTGIFFITASIHESGCSQSLSNFITKFNSFPIALLCYMFFLFCTTLLFTNDASAILGVPLAIAISRKYDKSLNLILLSLCATITISSVTSPIGNPQNILVATDPFLNNAWASFFHSLFMPTLLCLIFSFVWFYFLIDRRSQSIKSTHQTLEKTQYKRKYLPNILISCSIFVVFIVIKISYSHSQNIFLSYGFISMFAAIPLFLKKESHKTMFQKLDWETIIFFISMFIVTGAVLKSNVLSSLLGNHVNQLGQPNIVAAFSFIGSQIFSNVPMVDIYLNLLEQKSQHSLMLLAAMSTIAGNLFLISAASNVIVLQQAEKYTGGQAFTFWSFFFVNLPITIFSSVCLYLLI